MKNSKGEILPQPYYDLARMRGKQYGGINLEFLSLAFAWFDTIEGWAFWCHVDEGESPEIPASSLAELEAWRKEREFENKVIDAMEKIAEPVTDNHTKTFKVGDKARIIGNTNTHNFPIGEVVILSEFGGSEWKCYYQDMRNYWYVVESDMELVEPDFKGMYEEMRDKLIALQTKHDDLVAKHTDLFAIHQKAMAECDMQPTRNWIAECAMMVYTNAGINLYDGIAESWEFAQKWAAEGKKRGHIN